MSEANKAHAATLRQLADIYEATEADIRTTGLSIHAWTKDELVGLIKTFGGKWKKETGTTSDYFMKLQSVTIPGLELLISRDSVCRKIVSYECEPLLKPEEEAELLEVANA